MKLRYFIPAMMAVVAALFTACSDDNDPTYLSQVQVSQSSIAFPAQGGSVTISLNAVAEWTIGTSDKAGIPDWVTISPASGGAGSQEVTFTATAATDSREATLFIECAGAKQNLNLIQQTEKQELQVVPISTVIAGSDGTTFRVRGVCTSNPDNEYGNWDIEDETGKVYIYGTCDKKGNKGKGTYPISGTNGWGFGVGDIITVEGPRKTYNGTIELVDVTVIAVEKSLIKVDSLSSNEPIPAEGGEITAAITCKGDGINVEIPAEAKDWLSISSVTSKTVTFRALANEGDYRKTTVVFKTFDNGKEYTAQAVIAQAAKPNAPGSEALPFTIAEAIAKCKEIGSSASEQVYYAKGKISSIKEVSTSYGNATFNISDDGNDENFVTCFRAYSVGNQKFTAEDEIAVGDEVVICGKLMNYKDQTPQFAQGCYIVSIKKANGAGSLAKPFTPAEANAFCQTLGEGNTTEDDYYVKGKIIEITDKNQFGTQYGNCTFYISADGTDAADKFYVYRTLYLGNKKYSDDSWVKPKAGDEVVICGKLMLYKDKDGNLVPETSANKTYIYSLNGKTE